MDSNRETRREQKRVASLSRSNRSPRAVLRETKNQLRGRWIDNLKALDVLPADIKPSGAAGWSNCRSPLRDEQHPSFGVHNDTGNWRDHGTGEKGGPVALVQRVKGIGRRQAIALLATVAGIDTARPESCPSVEHAGLTVDEYARAKHFDAARLRDTFGIRDASWQGRPAVAMPYFDNDDEVLATRYRISMAGDRFRWSPGAKAHDLAYGRQLVATFRGPRLLVAEGESNLHAAHARGLECLTVPGFGMAHAALAAEILKLTAVTEVVVLLDPEGQQLADGLARELQRINWRGTLRAVTVKDVVGVKDSCDLHVKHAADPAAFSADVERLVSAARPVRILPRIVVTDRPLPEVTDASLAALRKFNEPPIWFVRGGEVVRIRITDSGATIEGATPDTLRGALSRCAIWCKDDAEGIVLRSPPDDVVRDVLTIGGWPLPHLTGLITSPTFAPSGRLIVAPGFDVESGLYNAPSMDRLLAIDSNPSREAVATAVALLRDELLVDFPFCDDASRATAIAALTLPFVRMMIPGATPLHLFESPTPGTGKGLITDAIGVIATGRAPGVMTEAGREEEWRKRLTAELRRGEMILRLDNLAGLLDSPSLASALTAPLWTDRLLGQSQVIALPVRCMWLATGNNVRMSRELARRTVLCRLDARSDQPHRRTGFRHPKLLPWVADHRPQFVAALLTIVSGWIAEGCRPGTCVLGSFEHYAAVIGGILEFAGVPGFLANADEHYAAADEAGAEWRAFFSRWTQQHGTNWVDSATIAPLLEGTDLFSSIVGEGRTSHGLKVRLGQELKRRRDCVFGGLRLEVEVPNSSGVARYRLQHLEASPGRNLPGTCPGTCIDNSLSQIQLQIDSGSSGSYVSQEGRWASVSKAETRSQVGDEPPHSCSQEPEEPANSSKPLAMPVVRDTGSPRGSCLAPAFENLTSEPDCADSPSLQCCPAPSPTTGNDLDW